ncbi:MAG: Xylulose kinase [Syntrophomonadaceae bacterium]|nr:Xylulose kinase [Bacillota bacterium]
MLLLGIDLGTSSIKLSVIDAHTKVVLYSLQFPDTENEIISMRTGWAEQSPETWWHQIKQAIIKANASHKYSPEDIGGIGISYQMHGLVLIDKTGKSLRNSIIWCDSRAVAIGDKAFQEIGEEECLSTLLNSPGNFTASKLAWVKANEPELYNKIDKVLLPGDYISYQLTGTLSTTESALSEGMFYDFKEDSLSETVLNYFGFENSFFPEVQSVFSIHGELKQDLAQELGLKAGIPVSYKAGDQPNNALALNVIKAGEVAVNAGTSGVIYAVSNKLVADKQSRINTFANTNYFPSQKSLGVLLCINGTGILNRWVKNLTGIDYEAMNEAAASIYPVVKGLRILPFGNGAERMLGNKQVGAHFHNIDLNVHHKESIFKAAQEGIAFAFRYGLDIIKENDNNPQLFRAGLGNMFLSKTFCDAFVNATQTPLELYNASGSVGAASGAGIGLGFYKSSDEAFENLQAIIGYEPSTKSDIVDAYYEAYGEWLALLNHQLDTIQ